MSDCITGNKIIVVKGDDTNWNNSPFLRINFNTETLDLSTFKAVFSLCGVTKQFNDLSAGYIYINLTSQETAQMPFGDNYGVLKLVDNSNRIATIESLIPFCFVSVVHDNSILTTPFNMDVKVEQGGENILNIDFSVAGTPWGSIYGNIQDQEDLMNALDGKQDVIADLEAIRSGAAKGSTALQKADITTGSANGTIAVRGTDVAVKGLESAAYTASTDYDPAGSASTAEQNAKDYADSLASNYDPAGAASEAEQNAKDYANSLASNYDPAGSAVTAEQNAKDYADGLASNYATAAQGLLADTALQPDDVIDNTSSSNTNKPLSANMGKSLQEQVNSLRQRGHFLSLWNCATGLAQSNPAQSPYTYQSGDYFIVGTIATGGGTNYRPSGSSYTTGVASTVVETQSVDKNDVYYYDGTNWLLQINTQKEISFGSVSGNPYDNTNLAAALNAKQDELTEGTGIDITNNTISNTGVRSIATGSTNGTISVDTGGTSAEVAVKGLGTAAYTASTSYATAAQGTKADTALQPADLNGYATETWVGQQGYITQAVDDSSTTSTTLGWSASKLNATIGDIESLLHNINSGS